MFELSENLTISKMQESSLSTRSISSLPLPSSLLSVLQSGGFLTLLDLEGITPRDLAKELNISMEDALTIVKQAYPTTVATNSSTELVKTFATRPTSLSSTTSQLVPMNLPIITFCRGVDSLLGGGIHSGQVTELCGVPGIGKTQMAMQLAIDVQIPSSFRGCGGEAVYIDTEGSFQPIRLRSMAEALVKHLSAISNAAQIRHTQSSQLTQMTQQKDSESEEFQRRQAENINKKINDAAAISVNSILAGVYVFRTHDLTELMAVIAQLSAFLDSHPKVRLVIIDSIAFPFRGDVHTSDSSQHRARLLSSISQDLYRNALQKNIAVLVVNHVTTKVFRGSTLSSSGQQEAEFNGFSSSNSTATIIPALGELWSHCITNRLMLHWENTGSGGQERVAYLVKSPTMPCARATFTILPAGVRDIPSSTSVHKGAAREEGGKEEEEEEGGGAGVLRHQQQQQQLPPPANLGRRSSSEINQEDYGVAYKKYRETNDYNR